MSIHRSRLELLARSLRAASGVATLGSLVATTAFAQFTVTGGNVMDYNGDPATHVGISYIGYDYQNAGIATTGTATLAGGATRNVEGGFYLGYQAGDTGTINVTGAGSIWTFASAQGRYIGYGGNGAVNITNSGQMLLTGGLSIGSSSDTASASLTIASGGVLTATSSIGVGRYQGFSSPSISVSGAGSLLSSGGGIQFDANSSLTVSSGGQATFSTIRLQGAAATATTTSLNVSGAGSLVSATGNFDGGFGSTGTSTVTVSDSGKLRVGGTFTMNRGTIKVGDGAAPGIIDTAAIYGNQVGSPTIEFNHTSNNYSFVNDAGNGIALNYYMGVNVMAGTTLFTGASGYSGGTTITGGTLILNNVGNGSTSGAGTGAITIGAAGTLIVGTGGTTGTIWSLSTITNNGQLTFNRSDAFSASGAISGSGILTKLGAGELTLSGNNVSYNGSIAVSGGMLTISHANGLGSTTGGTTVASGSTLKFSTLNGSFAEPITVSGIGAGGIGALYATSNTTLSGPVTFAGDTTIGISNSLTSLTISGVIGESVVPSGLIKSGNGALILTNANTYTGATTLNAGILNIQNSGALGTGTLGVTVASGAALQLQGNLTVSGQPLTINGPGFSSTNGALRSLSGDNTWTGNVTIGNASLIQVDAGSLTFSGAVDGSGNVSKAGPGNLILSGAGTLTGTAAINAGTLTLAHPLALQSAILAPGAGTVSFGSLTNATVGGLTSTSGLALTNASSGGVALTVNSTVDSVYHGILSGAGSLTKTGAGILTLYGNSTLSTATNVTGGTLRLGNTNALQYSALAIGSGGTLDFAGGSTATIAGLSGSGNITLSTSGGTPIAATLTVNTTATSSFDGTISGLGHLTKAGTGSLTLNGTNTFTGNLSVTGGTVIVGNPLALQSATFNGNNPGTLAFGDLTSATFRGIVANTGSLTNVALTSSTNAGVALTINNTATNYYGGALSGLGSLTKTGTGTLSLGGANSYADTTTVSTGTLGVLHASGLGTTAAGTTVADGATLEIAGVDIGAEPLTLAGSGVGGAGALTTVNYSTASGPVTLTGNTTLGGVGGFVLSGNISESGGSYGITKVGTMSLTLSGNNSFTGVTTVSNGRLTVGHANGLGTTAGGTVVTSGGSLEIFGV
ncbi:MAG: autotransporter-associated beta strand repeat-containing protein, partial [Verrucomicrobiota bacterium]